MTPPLASSTWHRGIIWSEADELVRRRHQRWRLGLGAMAVVALAASSAWYGVLCAREAQTTYRKVGITAKTWAIQLAPECGDDADCVLQLSLVSCCGTCAPARPYVAVPRARMATILREASEACAPRTRLCEPPVCPAAELVDVRAVCSAGRCRAVELGRQIAREGGTADALSEGWRFPCLE